MTDYGEFVRTVRFIEQSAPAGDGPPILCTSAVRLDDGPAITYHGAWSVSSDGSGHGVVVTVTADPQDLQVTESESDFPRWLRVRWHGHSLLTPIGEAAIAELLTETIHAPVPLRFYAAEIHVESKRGRPIEDLIEASSLGTPEAKAARAVYDPTLTIEQRHTLTRLTHPPYDSDALSRAVGVEPPGDGVRHTAMGDVRWCMALWDAIHSGTPTRPILPGAGS